MDGDVLKSDIFLLCLKKTPHDLRFTKESLGGVLGRELPGGIHVLFVKAHMGKEGEIQRNGPPDPNLSGLLLLDFCPKQTVCGS